MVCRATFHDWYGENTTIKVNLNGANVSVGPEQYVLQLRLLLVDPLHGQSLVPSPFSHGGLPPACESVRMLAPTDILCRIGNVIRQSRLAALNYKLPAVHSWKQWQLNSLLLRMVRSDSFPISDFT